MFLFNSIKYTLSHNVKKLNVSKINLKHDLIIARRFQHSGKGNPNVDQIRNKRIRSTLYYVSAAGVLTVGLSYAAVPLYRMFCQVK